MNRRTFFEKSLRWTGAALAASLLTGSKTVSKDSTVKLGRARARVIIARNPAARTKTGSLSASGVKKLLDTAMENLFQVTLAETAWKQLIRPDDIVGLKPNCLAGKGMSTHPELIDAVVESLLQVGVKKNQIIIWERLNDDLERAGYKIYYGRNQVQYYGNDVAGYTKDLHVFREIGSLLSRVVAYQCNVLINLPILKDHGIVGFSGGLKNYFGAIHNPNKYHNYIGDPYVADVNCLPVLKNKTRITICDALTAQYEGGPPFMPQWAWPFNGLLVAIDPVAIDRVGWQIIEDKRKEMKMPSLAQAGREPRYIFTAADSDHRLGICNLDQIELVKC